MKYILYSLFFIGLIIVIFFTTLHFLFPLKYRADIEKAAEMYGVDKVLIASIINAESGYDPESISPKGAVGLMQVLPSTADYVSKSIDVSLKSENLHDPTVNIMIGTRYLKYLLDKFSDTKTALIAYNAGEGKVFLWLKDERYSTEVGENTVVLASCPYKQTNAYVEKVLNGMKFYKHKF